MHYVTEHSDLISKGLASAPLSALSSRYRYRSQLGLLTWCLLSWLLAHSGATFLDEQNVSLWYLSRVAVVALPIAWLMAAPYFWIADTKKGFYFTKSDIIYCSGWLCPSLQTIPIKRIQHIEIKQGLLDRPFGLYRVYVLPAGKGMVIPGLTSFIANQIRKSLMDRVEVEDDEQ